MLFKYVAIITTIIVFGGYNIVRTQSANIDSNKDIETSISYCNFNVSRGLKLANLSFNSLYTFKVDEKGEIIEIKKIRDDYIGEEIVKPCIMKWKIKGFSNNSIFGVSFEWRNSRGWINQKISGNGFTLVMNAKDIGIENLEISQ